MCFVKKAFLKISQKLQKNTCPEYLFNKVKGLKVRTFQNQLFSRTPLVAATAELKRDKSNSEKYFTVYQFTKIYISMSRIYTII